MSMTGSAAQCLIEMYIGRFTDCEAPAPTPLAHSINSLLGWPATPPLLPLQVVVTLDGTARDVLTADIASDRPPVTSSRRRSIRAMSVTLIMSGKEPVTRVAGDTPVAASWALAEAVKAASSSLPVGGAVCVQ